MINYKTFTLNKLTVDVYCFALQNIKSICDIQYLRQFIMKNAILFT